MVAADLDAEPSQLLLYIGDRTPQRGRRSVGVALALESAHVLAQSLGIDADSMRGPMRPPRLSARPRSPVRVPNPVPPP